MIPRFGEVRRSGISYRLRTGAYAILPRNGQLLLTLQDDTDEPYQLPGGGIDPGESPIQALHREIMEETGWRVGAAKKFGLFRRFVFMPEYDMWAEKICHVYLAKPVRAVSNPTEPGHRAIWMDGNTAVQVLGNPGDRQMLRMALSVVFK